ncbi:hypothetical protein Psi02_34950 [Planotetraspora silvatica]|uniref:Class F sortase n=1 Tax=Planotetraspora silvatica TaxID=234614 RepID=A0A8J3UPI0_9ACTN|nr:class F sortase [Planotetraspora silvatica]GII47071.1 hypothetical protein Psi02_34950 [Planotetraspora silvatica]
MSGREGRREGPAGQPGPPVDPWMTADHPHLVYGPPPQFFQPVILPQQEPWPGAEGPSGGGSTVLRGMLLLAAVAGVVIIVFGLVLILRSPEEYESPARSALKVQALAPTVGPGGAAPLSQADPTAPPPRPADPAAAPMQPSTPKRLIIPRLGVNAPVESVGTDKSGAIETPSINDSNLVGWYRGGPTAGEAGPAVMLGHKDTVTRAAVFTRLHEIRNGDKIEVVRLDGTTAIFTVGGVEQANKQTFPTDRVYGPRDDAELRLITCGGSYNQTTGHYVDNIIVYALMTGTRPAVGKP